MNKSSLMLLNTSDEDKSVVLTVGSALVGKGETGYGYMLNSDSAGSINRIPYWLGKESGTVYYLCNLYNVYLFGDLSHIYVQLWASTVSTGSAGDVINPFTIIRTDTGESSNILLYWGSAGVGYHSYQEAGMTSYFDAILDSDEGKQITLAFDPPPRRILIKDQCTSSGVHYERGFAASGRGKSLSKWESVYNCRRLCTSEWARRRKQQLLVLWRRGALAKCSLPCNYILRTQVGPLGYCGIQRSSNPEFIRQRLHNNSHKFFQASLRKRTGIVTSLGGSYG